LVAKVFGLSLEEATSLRIVPIVVTNQGACFGLLANGARIVDFHFLNLYLSDNEYVSRMAFDIAEGTTVPEHETLYQDEDGAATHFESTMKEPPPLKRLLASAVWTDNRFPMSNGGTLSVSNCMSSGADEDSPALKTLLSFRQAARRPGTQSDE
jgi:hypothetical protein